MSCYYQCINGAAVPLGDNCPAHNCPSGFACYLPDAVFSTPCPPPFGAPEVDDDAKE